MPEELPPTPGEVDEALAIRALLCRVAAPAGVHVYEYELLGPTEYVCRVWIGQALDQLLGGVPDGMDGETAWEACVHPDDRAAYDAVYPQLHRGIAADVEYRLVGFDGVTRWVWERSQPRRTPDGRRMVDGIVTDVTERRRAQEELRAARDRLAHLAYHDPLTGLANRLRFDEQLARTIDQARGCGEAFAVLLIDLDHVKTVNDGHGHEVGDQLLRAVAERLRGAAHDCEVVARLGGDEFLLLARRDATVDEARARGRAVAERLQSALGEPLSLPTLTLVPSASVGVAVYPADGAAAAALLRHADREMYGVKSRNRGRAA